MNVRTAVATWPLDKMDTHDWAEDARKAYRAVKAEQERRFPDARLLDWGTAYLVIDGPGFFAPQRVEKEA